jgi:alpha-ketoglutarate-dependent taurine dioxygenase
LESSPVICGVNTDGVQPESVTVKSGALSVKWGPNDPVKESSFEPSFLRAYADLVAKQLEPCSAPEPLVPIETDWIAPYDSTSKVGQNANGRMRLWKNDDKSDPLPYIDYNTLKDPKEHVKFLRTILETHGVCIMYNMPDDPECDGTVLDQFCKDYLGGLQKHPLRETAHWRISTEETKLDDSTTFKNNDDRTGSNSFNTDQQLCNHTDQSLYGTPGALLMFHCAFGEGNNSVTDGFAVADKMRREYPEYYELLCTYGMNAGRELQYYKAGDITFTTCAPIFNRAANGELSRVQYHEIYRAPLTMDYETFGKWYKAFNKWYELCHGEEFKRHAKVAKGQLLICNNWRTMHGRAGLKGKARIILGGTVTRDAVYSAGRLALSRAYGVPDVHCGAPVSLLPYLAQRSEPLAHVTMRSSPRATETRSVAMEDDSQLEQPRKKMMMA